MDAHDFSKAAHDKQVGPTFGFGIDRKAWSRTLREMADALDEEVINPQQATVYTKAHFEEFPETVVVLKFVEKVDYQQRKVERVFKKLYGPDSDFPLVVAEAK